mgnify:CR=1 FL=1
MGTNKRIMKKIVQMLSFLSNYGWKGLYSLKFRVSWEQDFNFKNGGYDIIHLGKNIGYFYGTKTERDKWLR